MSWRPGNPRAPRPAAERLNRWRLPQGRTPGPHAPVHQGFAGNSFAFHGSYNNLSGASRFPGVDDANSRSRRNSASSTSSDQSHQRRNQNTRYQRGGNSRGNFHDRHDQNRDYRRGDANDYNASGFSRGRRPMGFKALENLLEKDPEELLLELSNSKRGFSELISSNLSEDAIVLFVKILKKVVDSSFEETKYKVLQTYLDEKFVEQLVKYILYLPMQSKDNQKRNRYFWNNSDEFWESIIKICQDIYDSLPTFTRKVVPEILKSLMVCFPSFEEQHNQHISDEIKEKVAQLNEAVQALIKEHEDKQKLNLQNKMAKKEEDEQPPDDFRQISIYPTSLELLAGVQPFLRKNVVEGAYKDIDHYLDVQFRLLREDFVGPLRSGIASYRLPNKSEGKKRIESVKIHKRVAFLNPETVNEQYCIRLRFDFSKQKKNFKYENSRRFMFGSLLCFTTDNFKTIIFGKVAERKEEDLQKGELIVGFDQNVSVQFNTDYLMVECGVYFEPYFHVLNVLQTMNVDNFPMKKYIIDVDSHVEPPEYLTRPHCKYSIRGIVFSPLINWPYANFYHLNESQQKAFKAALTQEFCIIQGPPGTGKTFLGLKIAKTLLENQSVWCKKTPMLVICYTNHALDQFLEGLTEFTTKILRVGGQSKNENLKSYNLRNKSRSKLNPAIMQRRYEVQVILRQIKDITENLKLMEHWNSLRSFEAFEDVVPDFKNTWFYRQSKSDILSWLFPDIEGERSLVQNVEAGEVAQVAESMNRVQIEDNEEESDDEDEIFDEAVEDQLDDLFEEVQVMAVQCSFPLLTLTSLRDSVYKLECLLHEIQQNENPTLEELIEEEKYNFELWKLKHQRDYLNMKLIEARQRKANIQQPLFVDLKNPHNMPLNDRWNLYFYWLNLYKEKLKEKLDLLNRQFRKEYKIYEQMRDIENTNSMKDVLVVGMTTTGAARLRSSLQALKSPVVIVEEAAEVLEAHIITSLTDHCQHLILIGDHQQLKPSTANYNVERFFSLGISLFERMVINKIQLYTLNVQHRMKPEISSLITPTIYPALEDHPSVNERPPIRGLDNCLFFINHTHKEDNCEGTSKKNYHEVSFLIQFAKHLVSNGYKPENITILAAYLGQMFEMQREKKKFKHVLENVRIAVLDNYQGEECDIILLSLVRSNDENKIGFLSIENRVCVALSRARNGFYVMGNMSQLCAASELWQKICRTLEQQNAIGTELPLRCQVHPDTVTYVKKGDDLLKISEGGCSQKCGVALVCGHKCTFLCHVLDRDHKHYKCRATCDKQLCNSDPGHLCKKMCYQECGPCNYRVQKALPCGHTVDLECHIDVDTYKCVVGVSTKLPCGHQADKPCHSDPETYRCRHPCPTKVEPCGHACLMFCHVRQDPDHLRYKCKKKCARYREGCTVETENHLCPRLCYEECEPCLIPVRKKRTVCSHVFDVPCSSDVDEVLCEKPCTKILSCGHKCKNKCYQPCGLRCAVTVEKTIPVCGHTVKVKCYQEASRSLCDKKCPLKLPCGHPCKKKCNQECTDNCKEIIDCAMLAPCGHMVTKIKCSIDTYNGKLDPKILLNYCNHPCSGELKCGHPCSGTCGECLQGRVHKRCTSKCGFPLVCNHACTFPCRMGCRPCTLPCPYKCKHSNCGKRCGDVCTPCKESCTRRCQHQRCRRICSDMCSVPACEEPCEKKLRCGHSCIGFCGDPCPKKCLVCDKEELTEIFLGFEEEEDARFVLLRDCGHILESLGLEGWMKRDEDKIGFKECPRCKTPIKTTQRYSDLIKMAMADVTKVKNNVTGTEGEIRKKKSELVQKLGDIRKKVNLEASSSNLSTRLNLTEILLKRNSSNIWKNSKLDDVFAVLTNRLLPDRKGKRQLINKPELNAIESKLQIVEHIIEICDEKKLSIDWNNIKPQVRLLMKILLREEDSITTQEIEDIQKELNRLTRMIDFEKIKKSPYWASRYSTNQVKIQVTEIEKLLLGFRKFRVEDEENTIYLLKELSKLVASGVGISESERRQIVQAMGYKQGHWYKCPNGHIYLITECGGANQESTCPDCGAKIGGTGHRLLSDNAVATEMDGARYGAWSEAANMANYQL